MDIERPASAAERTVADGLAALLLEQDPGAMVNAYDGHVDVDGSFRAVAFARALMALVDRARANAAQ